MYSPIEDVKSRLNIVDVVNDYVRLQKAGINFKTTCPFHGEKTPSFFVSPTRQIWHCFGCGRGGDVFKFVMEIEGYDFSEALRLLAARAGVVLKREDPKLRSERNRLFDLCERAAEFFSATLAATPAAKKYLASRGVTPETVRDFRLGYAPRSWDAILRALREWGFTPEEAEKAGLLVRSEDKGSLYDRFRGRIIFPIADQSGHVIGFGGRIFEESSRPASATDPPEKEQSAGAKYINTPQTPIYDKSRVLYGFDRAKQEIRATGTAVIVEGYMDCIMSHQAGVKNTVAVSGTAMTPAQLGAIKRIADTLLFSFDTDAAGESATRRSLALATEYEFERKVIEIPEGKDPADAVREDSHTWKAAVSGALPVVEFFYRKAFSRFDPKTADGKKAISTLVLPYIAELRDEIQKAHWADALARDLAIPREAVIKELARRSAPGDAAARSEPPETAGEPSKRRKLLEERLLALMSVLKRSVRDSVGASPYISFVASDYQELFDALRRGADSPPLHLADLHSTMRFKGEILAEMTESPVEELRVAERELEKECVRERLLSIGREIEQLERTGKSSDIEPLLNDFKTLSFYLKSLS